MLLEVEDIGLLSVTVFYDMPIEPGLDDSIRRLAELYCGSFIGSGSDGEERDLAFLFPKLKYQLPNPLILFVDGVISLGCVVLLSDANQNESSSHPLSIDAKQKSVGLPPDAN